MKPREVKPKAQTDVLKVYSKSWILYRFNKFGTKAHEYHIIP